MQKKQTGTIPFLARRKFAVIATIAALLCAVAAPASAQGVKRLRDAGAEEGVLIGALAQVNFLGSSPLSEERYRNTLAQEYSLIINDRLRWDVTEPQENVWNWSDSDAVMSFANNLHVRGHTLVYATQNIPAWVEAITDRARLRTVTKRHIETVMNRYKAGSPRGRIYAYDVVNEPFYADGTLKPSPWRNSPGLVDDTNSAAYIEQIFKWAREADPGALLFLNDNACENVNAKSTALYNLASRLRGIKWPNNASGRPLIDGVGFQAHMGVNFNLNEPDGPNTGMYANMRRFNDLGVQIHITEMDVGIPVNPPGSNNVIDPTDVNLQRTRYAEVISKCLPFPKFTAFCTWGFTDQYSWLQNFNDGRVGAGLPFSETAGNNPNGYGASYVRKPAYFAIWDTFHNFRP